jgi:hypothetical protein
MHEVCRSGLSETNGMNKDKAPGTDPAGTLPIRYPAVPERREADRSPLPGALLTDGLIFYLREKRGIRSYG